MMMRHLKVTAGLLLLLHTIHLVALQTTSRPRPTIDKSWLRQPPNGAIFVTGSVGGFTEGESSDEHDWSTSGALDEVGNETSHEVDFVNSTVTPVDVSGTTEEQQQLMTANRTDALDSTTSHSNRSSESNSTMAAVPPAIPDTNDTDPATPLGTNITSPTLGMPLNITDATTIAPEPNVTNASSFAAATAPADTTRMEAVSTTVTVWNVSAMINGQSDGSSSGDGSERGGDGGSAPNSSGGGSSRRGVWAAVLGTGVAVAIVGLLAFVIMKRKQRKDFYHRKLVEEFPSDPVFRLDNGEPLDLNFGRSAFSNPTLQVDDIQMSNFPKRA